MVPPDFMAFIIIRFSSARMFTASKGTAFHSLQLQNRSRLLLKAKCLQWRPFTLTMRQLAVTNSKSAVRQFKPKSQPAVRPLQASKENRSGYESFSESLARRPSPTTLYEAPSPYLYITGCYVLATACFAYAGVNFESIYLHPPEQIGYWIPIAVGGVCVAMALFGVWSTFGVCVPS